MQSAFNLWMLVDAIRRGSGYPWYMVIWLPFGSWVYFFTVKIHDPEFRWLKDLVAFRRPEKITIEKLRYQLSETPSFGNKVALAQALHDKELYREAADLFAEALQTDESAKDALFGLGLCHISLNEPAPAIENLRKVIALDPAFSEYAAWFHLAFALSQSGRREEILDLLDELVRRSPRLNHRLFYAHHLAQAERRQEAIEQIRAALEDHKHAPGFLRRQNRRGAKKAGQMLKELGGAP